MMSLLVNIDGEICLASDAQCKGTPAFVHFNPEKRSVSVIFDDGSEQVIGSAGQSEMVRQLRSARHVHFMQIQQGPGRPVRNRLPLYIQMEDAQNRAAV